MSDGNNNELTTGAEQQQLLMTPQEDLQQRGAPTKRRGRPKGSRNKPKLFAQPEEGWAPQYEPARRPAAKPRSGRMYRKWQREWIKPQFVLTRKEAYDLFLNFLRSIGGKDALREMIVQGSPGVGKLNDVALGKYLEQTNLLSRYPHSVVVKS